MAPLVFLLLVTLPLLYAAWSDLRFMRIPNEVSLALLGLFVVSAPFLVGLPEMGWRLGIGAAVLITGFVLNALKLIGGGDVKLLSAGILFVDPSTDHLSLYLQVLGMMSLAGVIVHRGLARVSPVRDAVPEWGSWGERGKFPFGLSISASILFYLGLVVILT
ncbi:prepilin peptidase CpaA [Rubricella aquisinus]|uniref:Prepilin peptidase CpaA n=1 Tax=Rubricella aquisinus TaxID=2028108 RepID=A0A840WXP2_9RHOB|nr:prepilin peptidase [Rubricella aquisinus]MBB5515940.1 prepilin peptidase CpaA [Rubricella aquisinus]